MSVAVPPRNVPVFDPVTGRVVGYEMNPEWAAFFGFGADHVPGTPGGNPAGLGSPDPETGEPIRPYTDPGVETGMIFQPDDFANLDAYGAAASGLVPEFYRDPITGEFDPMRAGTVDYRGRPAGMFNQGMEGVALENWARNNPQAAAELYWAMAPAEVDPVTGEILGYLPHLTPGEQRIIALAIGPDLIEAERNNLLDQAGLQDIGDAVSAEPQPDAPAADGSSFGQTQYGGGQYGVPYFQGDVPPPPSGTANTNYSGYGSAFVPDQVPYYLPDGGAASGQPGVDVPLPFDQAPQEVQDAYAGPYGGMETLPGNVGMVAGIQAPPPQQAAPPQAPAGPPAAPPSAIPQPDPNAGQWPYGFYPGPVGAAPPLVPPPLDPGPGGGVTAQAAPWPGGFAPQPGMVWDGLLGIWKWPNVAPPIAPIF